MSTFLVFLSDQHFEIRDYVPDIYAMTWIPIFQGTYRYSANKISLETNDLVSMFSYFIYSNMMMVSYEIFSVKTVITELYY